MSELKRYERILDSMEERAWGAWCLVDVAEAALAERDKRINELEMALEKETLAHDELKRLETMRGIIARYPGALPRDTTRNHTISVEALEVRK